MISYNSTPGTPKDLLLLHRGGLSICMLKPHHTGPRAPRRHRHSTDAQEALSLSSMSRRDFDSLRVRTPNAQGLTHTVDWYGGLCSGSECPTGLHVLFSLGEATQLEDCRKHNHPPSLSVLLCPGVNILPITGLGKSTFCSGTKHFPIPRQRESGR